MLLMSTYAAQFSLRRTQDVERLLRIFLKFLGRREGQLTDSGIVSSVLKNGNQLSEDKDARPLVQKAQDMERRSRDQIHQIMLQSVAFAGSQKTLRRIPLRHGPALIKSIPKQSEESKKVSITSTPPEPEFLSVISRRARVEHFEVMLQTCATLAHPYDSASESTLLATILFCLKIWQTFTYSDTDDEQCAIAELSSQSFERDPCIDLCHWMDRLTWELEFVICRLLNDYPRSIAFATVLNAPEDNSLLPESSPRSNYFTHIQTRSPVVKECTADPQTSQEISETFLFGPLHRYYSPLADPMSSFYTVHTDTKPSEAPLVMLSPAVPGFLSSTIEERVATTQYFYKEESSRETLSRGGCNSAVEETHAGATANGFWESECSHPTVAAFSPTLRGGSAWDPTGPLECETQLYLRTVPVPEWVPVWSDVLEREVRETTLTEVEAVQRSLHQLRDLTEEMAAQANAEMHRVEETACALEETSANTNHAARELAKASKRRTKWWGIKTSVPGMIGGSLLTVGLGPIGLVAGATLGGAVGLAAGNTARRRHSQKMDRILERLNQAD